jgi:hypothetical protein
MLVCSLIFTVSSPSGTVNLLHKSRMAVFPHHMRANERCQLAGDAAFRVVPGPLQDRGALPGDGILPDLADFYRSAIRRAVRVGVRHLCQSLVFFPISTAFARGPEMSIGS